MIENDDEGGGCGVRETGEPEYLELQGMLCDSMHSVRSLRETTHYRTREGEIIYKTYLRYLYCVWFLFDWLHVVQWSNTDRVMHSAFG